MEGLPSLSTQTYISLGIDVDTDGGSASPKADVSIWMVEVWGSYEVMDRFELLGGARWQQQEIAVNFGLPSPPFPGSEFGVKDDWLDWFIGGRFTAPLPSHPRVAHTFSLEGCTEKHI